MSKDAKMLAAVLTKAGATPLEVKMASIILGVRGLPAALEFVAGMRRPVPDDDGRMTLADGVVAREL